MSRDPLWHITDAAGLNLGSVRAASATEAVAKACRGIAADGTERATLAPPPFPSRVDLANGGAVHAAVITEDYDRTACGRWVGGRRARRVPVWLPPTATVTCGTCARVLAAFAGSPS